MQTESNNCLVKKNKLLTQCLIVCVGLLLITNLSSIGKLIQGRGSDIYEYIMSNQDLWKGCNISATNSDKIRGLVFNCDDTSRFITLNLKEKK